MIQWLKRINAILTELILILIIYAVVVELIGVWFMTDKLNYSIGVLTGLGLGIFMLIHMAVIIEDSLMVMDRKSKVWISVKAIFRYLIIGGVVTTMVYFQWGNFISCFITILGVKVAAYTHPFLHRKLKNKHPKEVNE